MKKALYLFLALLIPVAIFIVGGFFLSSKYEFEETITITSTRKQVFAKINSLENWASWSAWSHTENPGLQVEYYGPENGKGAGQTFMHKKGTGKIEIIESDPEKNVELEMKFGGAQPVYHSIEIDKSGKDVNVTWKVHGEMDYGIASGWLALLTPRTVRGQVAVSLYNLKQEVEGKEIEPGGN